VNHIVYVRAADPGRARGVTTRWAEGCADATPHGAARCTIVGTHWQVARGHAHNYDVGITRRPVDRATARTARRFVPIIMSSKSSKAGNSHQRKLTAALKKMGTSLATHTESTFKPSGMASKTLEEFKARRAAERMGLLPSRKAKVVERYEIDVDTATVTKLPLRMKTR
jgi:hypothetical protein